MLIRLVNLVADRATLGQTKLNHATSLRARTLYPQVAVLRRMAPEGLLQRANGVIIPPKGGWMFRRFAGQSARDKPAVRSPLEWTENLPANRTAVPVIHHS